MSMTAFALSAAWPGGGARPTVIEADRRGGDAALRFGLTPDPGLRSLAAAARSSADIALLAAHTRTVGAGAVPVVAAPELAEPAGSAVWALMPLLEKLAASEDPVLLDLGAVCESDRETIQLLELCEVLLLVARPDAAQLGRARASGWLREQRFGVRAVLVGEADADEVEALIGVPVAGVLPLLPPKGSREAKFSGRSAARRFNQAASALAKDVEKLAAAQCVPAGAAS
ncbi:hypothetical protein [Catenulispora pinisilvae]|uniref:hypothetical protein n=1 Tax=Catenulispora pinisilvae TaxID=2705253 RepID=UPI001891BA8E|nr:hypothetical protein [Catenulispora pinisilvae]